MHWQVLKWQGSGEVAFRIEASSRRRRTRTRSYDSASGSSAGGSSSRFLGRHCRRMRRLTDEAARRGATAGRRSAERRRRSRRTPPAMPSATTRSSRETRRGRAGTEGEPTPARPATWGRRRSVPVPPHVSRAPPHERSAGARGGLGYHVRTWRVPESTPVFEDAGTQRPGCPGAIAWGCERPEGAGGVVHELPADLRKALVANGTALDAWMDITPLARNEFICWVEDAKQEATRERRIRRTKEELEEGQRRPCCWPGCKHRERTGK